MHLLVRKEDSERLVVKTAQTRRERYREYPNLHNPSTFQKNFEQGGQAPLASPHRMTLITCTSSISTGNGSVPFRAFALRLLGPPLHFALSLDFISSSGKAVKQPSGDYLERRNPTE
jgi:hypothetical protein